MESQLAYYVSDVRKFPILDSLMCKGQVWICRDQIIGLASDNQTVCLGNSFSEKDIKRVENYLNSHPTPDTW